MKKAGTFIGALILIALVIYALGGFNNIASNVEDAADTVVDAVTDTGSVDTGSVDENEDAIIIVEDEEEAATDTGNTVDADGEVAINAEESTLLWEGRAAGKSHNGDITITEGSLVFAEGKVTGGTFTVDMTTINSTDLEGGSKERLDEHLQADDYFDVANYPTAVFTITSVDGDTVTGDLTIKGETHPVTFDVSYGDNIVGATFSIDSTKWGVQEGGSIIDQAKNALVNNDIDFVVALDYSS